MRTKKYKTLQEVKNDWPEIPFGKVRIRAGDIYNRAKVIYRTINYQGQYPRYVCQCTCEDEVYFVAIGSHLISGSIQSCGCINREKHSQYFKKCNLQNSTIKIGNRYGKLTVIEHLGLRKQQSRDKLASWYLCLCDCGNYKEVSGNSLQSGGVKSCGCICSYGEYVIKMMLDDHHITYKQQFYFDDLVGIHGRYLRFDFAIFDENKLKYLIEYDGRQHKDGPEAKWTQSYTLEDIIEHDGRKNKYCIAHNIPLIRIPSNHLKEMKYEDLLLETTPFLIKFTDPSTNNK